MLFRMLRLIGAYESVLVALHQVLYAIPDKAIPSGWKGVGQEVRGLDGTLLYRGPIEHR